VIYKESTLYILIYGSFYLQYLKPSHSQKTICSLEGRMFLASSHSFSNKYQCPPRHPVSLMS
jgi:hypothetical protein